MRTDMEMRINRQHHEIEMAKYVRHAAELRALENSRQIAGTERASLLDQVLERIRKAGHRPAHAESPRGVSASTPS